MRRRVCLVLLIATCPAAADEVDVLGRRGDASDYGAERLIVTEDVHVEAASDGVLYAGFETFDWDPVEGTVLEGDRWRSLVTELSHHEQPARGPMDRPVLEFELGVMAASVGGFEDSPGRNVPEPTSGLLLGLGGLILARRPRDRAG